jgi:hypothetical protein
VTPPLGLAGLVIGVQPDTWTGPSATYTSYRGSHGSRIKVTISRPKLTGPPPAQVTAAVGSAGLGRTYATKRWTLQNGTRHVFELPLRRGPFEIQLSVSPTFVPSQFGLSDTRTLGVQVTFG